MIIWITGLSGAGKTSICEAVMRRLKPSLPQLVHVDGDAVRDLFGNDLTFMEADRVRQIGRIQRLARILDQQGLIVLVAALYASPALLQENRRLFPRYHEVYLEAPIELVWARNTKGLYEAGVENVVGVDIPWHAPANPDLVLRASNDKTVDELADALIADVAELSMTAGTQIA